MSYSNPFLTDFAAIFFAIVKEKELSIGKLEYIIIDEEADGHHVFEPADVLDVLWQLKDEMNALTVYTDRRDYFLDFLDYCYEENGLISELYSKKQLKNAKQNGKNNYLPMILDFEWERGQTHTWFQEPYFYIPIHKKAWKMGKNLDIMVPFGYNSVNVKRTQMTKKVFVNDRFDKGFYRNESIN